MNPLPNDDYNSMTPGQKRERQSKAKRAFDLMKAIDLDRSSFRCRMCGEWFKMNFKSASNPNVCNKCEP